MQHAFEVIEPKNLTSGVVVATPHSGRAYPAQMISQSILDSHMLRASEDAFVDQLVADTPQFGAPLLIAHNPRAYVDLNRSHDELDSALIKGLVKTHKSARVAAGLGVIPRIVAAGRPIYSGKLSLNEAHDRLNTVWFPYHMRLQQLLRRAHDKFGYAVLIDVHSMPRSSLGKLAQLADCPQIVIGDLHGRSAHKTVTELVEAALMAGSLRCIRNAPFAGAFIAENYGKPSKNYHVIQLEIDRSLYMDERTLIPNLGYAPLKRTLSTALEHIITAMPDHLSYPNAAQ